jgi:AcrR family transcriptional regulator
VAEVADGRAAQRRRTRLAIVEAAKRLVAEGASPSVNEIAEAADVSRRTVYLHFPSLDHLLIDAIVGLMGAGVDDALSGLSSPDPRVRLRVLVEAVSAATVATLPLGRRLIALTIERPDQHEGPVRGYRRVAWIETAIEPLRDRLGTERFERLVSSLAMVVGFEAFVVLFDIRGLDADEARAVVLDAALALLDAAT